MSRTIRYLTVTVCLFLLLGIKTRGSQEVEVDAFANPSPYTVGDTIEIDVDSFWEDPPSQCDGDDCELESIDIEISGDDGFEDSSSGSSEASFFDSQATGSDVSYGVDVTVTYFDFDTFSEIQLTGSGSAFAAGPTAPNISGPDELWWFEGESPSNYATSITLTSDAGASTQWAITSGSDIVNLSTSTGSSVTVTSTSWSSGLGDVVITATANGVTSGDFHLTSRTPFQLAWEGVSTSCDGTWGYESHINYDVQDQFGSNLPGSVPINEQWTTGVVNDWSGTNWRRGPEGSATTTGSSFFDRIQGELSSMTPQPVCSGDATPVEHWGQGWWVGSLSIGSGRFVQGDTLQKRRDYAEHTNIF